MKTIVFVSSLINVKHGEKVVDLLEVRNAQLDKYDLVGLSEVYSLYGKQWLADFSSWFGELNKNNAGKFWWAHTSTAKNFLSSPIGSRFFQVLAVCRIAQNKGTSTLYVLGATPAQMESICSLLPKNQFKVKGFYWQIRFAYKLLEATKAFLRIPIQCLQTYMGFFGYKIQEETKTNNICLFTYIDREHVVGIDGYFGKLLELLEKENNLNTVEYLAFFYKPYKKRIRQLLTSFDSSNYIALFGNLRLKDYIWALSMTFYEGYRTTVKLKCTYSLGDTHNTLLKEIFIYDIALGGYFHNLLVYRACCNYIVSQKPKIFIYPYENKSLEKMMLFAVREVNSKLLTIGFQHTAITPRHITLLFQEGEANATPLPDKIITVGNVTKNYLEEKGNYPPAMLTAGCALRQTWRAPLPRESRLSKKIKVLLALSSSENELVKALTFFKQVMVQIPEIELGIRPHCNFPLSLLSQELSYWVAENTIDFSNSTLEENLKWCTVTAYVSSTVALESLMLGKPVVNFSIGDSISPDPVLTEIAFHWMVDNQYDLIKILRYVKEMPDKEYEKYKMIAIAYVRDYFLPIDKKSLQNFVKV